MRLAVALVLLPFALPTLAQEGWPVADTAKLEVSAAGIVVTVPAPPWIGEAMSHGTEPGGDTAHAEWFTGGGFDIRSNSLDVTIQSLDDYQPYATRYIGGYSDECETLHSPTVTRVGEGFQDAALCGRERGSGRGVIVYTLAVPTPDRHVVDIWYRTEVEPFDARDEASWPMTPGEFDAFVVRLTDAITVTAGGEALLP